MYAVEFAKFKIGKPCYEDIAELYQAVEQSTLSQDLSGDAIRKKVGYIKKNYPHIYEAGEQVALRMILTSAVIDRDLEVMLRALQRLTPSSILLLPLWLTTFFGPPKDPKTKTRLEHAIGSAIAQHLQRLSKDIKP